MSSLSIGLPLEAGLIASQDPSIVLWKTGMSAVALAALALWLLLPPAGHASRAFGCLAGAAALVTAALALPTMPSAGETFVFWLLAAVTVVSAVAAITCHSPVYSAIWFAFSLLGTAGLFLYQGAQFVGVATIAVYAGAIVVTFLFVVMLAQPEGRAPFDRMSWGVAARLGSVLVAAGILSVIVLLSIRLRQEGGIGEKPLPLDTSIEASVDAGHGNVLHRAHLARFGREVFGRHLLAVEVVGLLLLIALVGAIAVVIQGKYQDEPSEGAVG